MFMEILIRSGCGFVFMALGAVLYFLYLNRSGKRQTPHHIICALILCYYLIGVLTMTGISTFKAFSPRLVLIPFVDMINGPTDTILNIVLFVPMGFFTALLYKRYNNIGRIALTGFLFSLSIELIQMFGMGATDINDLLTNTAGACLGYFIYFLLSKIAPTKLLAKFHANDANENGELLLFIVLSFVIMLTIQPWVMSAWTKT